MANGSIEIKMSPEMTATFNDMARSLEAHAKMNMTLLGRIQELEKIVYGTQGPDMTVGSLHAEVEKLKEKVWELSLTNLELGEALIALSSKESLGTGDKSVNDILCDLRVSALNELEKRSFVADGIAFNKKYVKPSYNEELRYHKATADLHGKDDDDEIGGKLGDKWIIKGERELLQSSALLAPEQLTEVDSMICGHPVRKFEEVKPQVAVGFSIRYKDPEKVESGPIEWLGQGDWVK